MSDSRNPATYEGWTAVFTTSTDFEADLVRDRLDEAGVPAVVLTQRDHAFNLNVGDLAPVRVMVPPDHIQAARAVLDAPAISDEELEAAAMAADVMAPDAHDRSAEAMLDSGMEEINLSLSDEIAASGPGVAMDTPPPPPRAPDVETPGLGPTGVRTYDADSADPEASAR